MNTQQTHTHTDSYTHVCSHINSERSLKVTAGYSITRLDPAKTYINSFMIKSIYKFLSCFLSDYTTLRSKGGPYENLWYTS